MIRKIIGGIILSGLLGTLACVQPENSFEALPPGVWRGVLQLDPTAYVPPEDGESILSPDNITLGLPEGSLPFLFEVFYDSQDLRIELINGEERILVDDVRYGRNIRTAIDTVYIDFPVFDSHISAQFREDVLEGTWTVRSKDNYSIPFVARYGESTRFTELKETPALDLTGKWEASFSLDSDPYPAIGEFVQDGNDLTGTFLTETGDYRFLAGTIQGDDFALSVFDGAHAFLFEGKILPDSTLIGSFRSGKHYKTTWEAKLNPDATLSDPNTLTYLVGQESFDFTFPDPDGNMVSLTDPAFEGKAKIVQIFGTWCPNCWDETRFLVNYLAENPTDKLAIIGLGFERYKDPEKAAQALRTYKEKMDIPYTLLHAGSSSKKEAAKALPMLNHVLSYPTMIFLDENNQVQKIHTGFAGPATSAYPAFVEEFESFVAALIK